MHTDGASFVPGPLFMFAASALGCCISASPVLVPPQEQPELWPNRPKSGFEVVGLLVDHLGSCLGI